MIIGLLHEQFVARLGKIVASSRNDRSKDRASRDNPRKNTEDKLSKLYMVKTLLQERGCDFLICLNSFLYSSGQKRSVGERYVDKRGCKGVCGTS